MRQHGTKICFGGVTVKWRERIIRGSNVTLNITRICLQGNGTGWLKIRRKRRKWHKDQKEPMQNQCRRDISNEVYCETTEKQTTTGAKTI